jgi:hypothetical protein
VDDNAADPRRVFLARLIAANVDAQDRCPRQVLRDAYAEAAPMTDAVRIVDWVALLDVMRGES